MYKVGDKVELWGTRGEIISSERLGSSEYPSNGEPIHTWFYDVSIPITGRWFSIGDKELKPYKSAHDKLIEMGWEEKIHDTVVKSDVESGRYKQYAKNYEVILIDIEDREFTAYTLYSGDKGVSGVSWVNHKLSRILTQYLEELE